MATRLTSVWVSCLLHALHASSLCTMVDDLYAVLVLHAQLTNPIHPQYSQCFPGTNDLSNTRPPHVCIMTFEHQRTGNLPKTPTGFCEMDRVGFSCLLLKRRGLATGSLFWGDWLLHHMPWSSSLQTAHYIQNCCHSIRPPPLRFNNKQLEPT